MSGVVIGSNNITINGRIIETGKSIVEPMTSPSVTSIPITGTTYKYISFINTGANQTQYNVTFAVNTYCDILIVGGGGGASGGHGGGGGAGQLIFIHNAILNGTYNIAVGKGGIGGKSTERPGGGYAAIKGFNSFFSTVIAEAGGTDTNILADKNGGSGAGGDGWTPDGGTAGFGVSDSSIDIFSSGTIYSRGNNGANGTYPAAIGGGGGGAGSAGTAGSVPSGGNGLMGISEITYDFRENFGTDVGQYIAGENKVYFAGGGSGGLNMNNNSVTIAGGKGGGGAGTSGGADSFGGSGLANTGGGGGGGSSNTTGGNGGSGIVIIRYNAINLAQWTYSSSNPNVFHLGNVGIGTTNPTSALHVLGSVQVDGVINATSLTANTKNFKIEHPLNINKWLYHGCVESPRFDNIYRGKKKIINGRGEVDIDEECNTTGGMTKGTFVALNTNCQVYLQNKESFTRVKGIINGAKITIDCNNTEEIEIDWLVIGERKDENIMSNKLTNNEGKLICEHEME